MTSYKILKIKEVTFLLYVKSNFLNNAKLTEKEVKLSLCYGSQESSVKLVTIKTRLHTFMVCF